MQRAQTLAADYNHDFLTLEHIVLAMIDDPDGKELMQAVVWTSSSWVKR